PAAKASVSRAGTRRPHGYRAPQASGDVSRKATPHFTAGLGDVLLSDLDVEIFPKSAQTATGVFRPVLLFQEVHKIQYFFLLLRRQITQFFEDLLFYGHACLIGDLVSLYASWTRFLTIWRGAQRFRIELRKKVREIGRAHVELQSLAYLVCRLLLEKKKRKIRNTHSD